MSIANTMLQRDPPLPSCRPRRGTGEGFFVDARQPARCGDGPVARQPFAPVGERHPQGLPKEKRAKSRAIDEKVALNNGTIFKPYAGDIAGFAVLQNFDDAPFNAANALLFGPAAEEPCITPGVELKRIGHAGQR